VQGEERDIVYYSFVEDKKINNGSLRNIYPTIGGSADNIRKLKMQRLNVGFSRAKDTMVFVHSMPIEDYSDTRLGDALKHYKHLLESAQDNFVKDESIFGSPAEKDLYLLITNTDFYRKNRDKIKIIAQFPIGKYIEETLHKYIPKYRVDFLITLSERGKEKSLILEYDGLEYHTKNPEIVTAHNFSQEYLDYDIERQLELESYGYKFLRINKFTLVPKEKGQTKIDVLSNLLEKKFNE
jgi:very-short-patch-repair endonuclease